MLGDIAQSVSEKMAEENINKEDVLGIGLTAPGPVLKDGTIKGAVNIGWGTFNIKK